MNLFQILDIGNNGIDIFLGVAPAVGILAFGIGQEFVEPIFGFVGIAEAVHVVTRTAHCFLSCIDTGEDKLAIGIIGKGTGSVSWRPV